MSYPFSFSTLKAPPVMEEAELLTLIPAPEPCTEKRESEEESEDDDDKEEENVDEEVKITLQNSIMKTEESESEEEKTEVIPMVKEETERIDEVESDEDEGIEEGSKEDSDEDRTSGVPLQSQDDLDANFIIEKIEGSSGSEDEEVFSEEGEEIEENPGTKRKGFSLDQLQLESKKSKNKRIKGSDEKGKEVHLKKKNKTGTDKFNKKRNKGEGERKKGKNVPTRQSVKGKKRKKIT